MQRVQAVGDAQFNDEVVNHSGPVLVQFWAPWCGPCRMLSPVIEELAAEYEGKLKFCKVNVDENPQSAAQFQATSIPLLALIRNNPENGEREAHLSLGYQPKEEVKLFIDTLVV